MRIVLVVIALFGALGFAKAADSILVDKIVAVVGDKVILLSDIELQYEQLRLEQDVPPSAKCELLDGILTNKLFLEAALQDSIAVSDDEVESELDRRISYFVSMLGGQDQLESYYGKSILEIKNEFRQDIREQLLSQRMQGKIYGNVQVGPNDVKKFFNTIPKDSLPYFNAEVEVGQIVMFPKPSEFSLEYARKKAVGVLNELEQGADFCDLARKYSMDPSNSDKCGDLGFVGRGEFVTEFEAAAFALEPGEYSDVVETKFGFHIVQLVEKKGNRIHARHILITPLILTSDYDMAREKMELIRDSLVSGKLTFPVAVNKYSEDDETKHQGGMMVNPVTGNTYFEMGQLDKATYFALEGLAPNEYSQPLKTDMPTGAQAYRIVLLKSQTDPHVASLELDYYKIQAAALKQKQDEALDKWLLDRIKETYIWVSPDYRNCQTVQKWYKDNVTETSYE